MPLARFRSVRYTILLWNSGILAVCLLGFCGLFREILKVRLLSLVDSQLSDRSAALINLWDSIPAVARDEVRDELNTGQIGSRLFVPEQSANAENPPATRPDESLTGIYRPRAFSPDGKSYFKGVNDSQLDAAAFARALAGEKVHSTVTIRGAQVRVYTIPMVSDGEVQFVLQSARDLAEYHSELQAITTDLLRAIPVLLIVAGTAGVVLTNRAMRPVRSLQVATKRIQAQDLSQRLPITGNDEFSQLTETLNEMFARLDSAFKQQAQFTADASHELRTPLTVLRGNTSLALVGDRSAQEYRSTIERTHKTIDSMSKLVEELLLLSRADSGQALFEADRVDVSRAIDDAVESTPYTGANQIQVGHTKEPVYVDGNHALLVRLFANLLNNAVNYSPPGKPISVSVTRNNANVKISVQDQGEGIDPAHMPFVMERFYRSDRARSKHPGSGLGLAICKSVVNAHSGSIQIESDPGEGTCVTVILPLAK